MNITEIVIALFSIFAICSTTVQLDFPHEILGIDGKILKSPDYNHGSLLKRDNPDIHTGSLNNLLDEIFSNLLIHAQDLKIDPLTLPDVEDNIDYNIYLTTLKIVVALTNGSLTKLEYIQRGGDSSISYDEGTQILTIIGEIEFPQLELDYDLDLQVNNFGPRGKLNGVIKKLFAEFELQLDLSKMKITLKKFTFPETGSISLTVDINIIYDFLINSLTEIITTIFKVPLMFIVQNAIKHQVQEILDNIM